MNMLFACRRLEAAVARFPWLGKIVSTERRSKKTDNELMSESRAAMLCRIAHLPSSLTRGITKGWHAILKIRAFMCRVILQMQISGLAQMMTGVEQFIAADAGTPGQQSVGVVGVMHSWDETKQMVRFVPSTSKHCKVPKMRIARDILVQRAMVHAHGIRQSRDGRVATHSRAETYICPPLELTGKATAQLVEAMQRTFPFPFHRRDAMVRLSEQTSALVLTFWGDSASTNRRLLKHVCGTCLSDEWPSNILVDPSQRCLLHQIHRVQVRTLEGHALVSLLYCLANLVRSGTVLPKMSDFIGTHVEKHCKRVMAPPPAEALDRSRRFFDLVYRLQSSHHTLYSAKGEGESELLKDVRVLLQMDPGLLEDSGEMIHYCWREGGHGPCCSGPEETKEKMTAAYIT